MKRRLQVFFDFICMECNTGCFTEHERLVTGHSAKECQDFKNFRRKFAIPSSFKMNQHDIRHVLKSGEGEQYAVWAKEQP